MDGGPCEPCQKAAYADLAALQNGETLADYGHVSFVEIAKWLRPRFAGNTPTDQFSGVPPLLNRHLGHAR